MNSGIKKYEGLCLNSPYSYEDCSLLSRTLYNKFKLESMIISTGAPSKYVIIIKNESLLKLECLVRPFIIKEMKYKLIPHFAKAYSHNSIIPANKPIHP